MASNEIVDKVDGNWMAVWLLSSVNVLSREGYTSEGDKLSGILVGEKWPLSDLSGSNNFLALLDFLDLVFEV